MIFGTTHTSIKQFEVSTEMLITCIPFNTVSVLSEFGFCSVRNYFFIIGTLGQSNIPQVQLICQTRLTSSADIYFLIDEHYPRFPLIRVPLRVSDQSRRFIFIFARFINFIFLTFFTDICLRSSLQATTRGISRPQLGAHEYWKTSFKNESILTYKILSISLKIES